jgi:hypothetical protein
MSAEKLFSNDRRWIASEGGGQDVPLLLKNPGQDRGDILPVHGGLRERGGRQRVDAS